MATPSSNEISFNTFYLTEFFNIASEKARDKIADSHLRILKGLSAYLLKEDKIIEGLEQVARYQNSNDLAIFLFDMIERANDYGPKVVYNTLGELASDFVNLYSLMMEDEESVDTFKKIVEEFQKKYGDLEKEKHLEDFLEMAQTDISASETTEEMDIAAYFKDALAERLLAEDAALLTIIFSGIDEGIAENRVHTALRPVFSRIKKVYPARIDSVVAGAAGLQKLAKFVNGEIKNIKNGDPNIISTVVSTHRLDVPAAKTEMAAQVPEPEEPVSSLDSLLVDYFRSEVEDWGTDVFALLDRSLAQVTSPAGLKQLIAATKSLKELSMIHGYSGLEHIAHLLTKEFEKLKVSSFIFSDASTTLLREIIGTLKHVEKFAEKSKSGEAVSNVQDKIDLLRQTYTEPHHVEETEGSVETVPEPAPEITEDTAAGVADANIKPRAVDEPESDWFGPDDVRFGQAILDIMKIMAQKAGDALSLTDTAESARVLSGLLRHLHDNAHLFPENFDSTVVSELDKKYAELHGSGNEIGDDIQKKLSGIWWELSNTPPRDITVDALGERIRTIIPTDAGIGLSDPQVSEALAQVIARRRDILGNGFAEAFDPRQSAEAADSFLTFVDGELKLIGAEKYQKFIAYCKEQIELSRTQPYPPEAVTEFSDAFNLFTERLGHQGIAGDCSDIIDALSDILPKAQMPDIPETDTAKEETKTSVADENEDLVLFREEASTNIQTIKDNLTAFKDDRERSHLNVIENASHSIRSAAHLLNFENAAKLAISVEDISEVFGQSEVALPDNIVPYLEQAVEQLERLLEEPDMDSSELIALLDSLLDQVAIQDSGTPQALTGMEMTESIPTLETPSDLGDESLFASDSGEDEELRNIFKEESVNFLNDISMANTILEKNPGNIQAAEKLGYAAHSLKSAAKMLGFIEISQITDNLEKLTDAINDGRLTYGPELSGKITEAMDILTQLSDGQDIDSTVIAQLIDSLDKSHWETNEPVEAENEETLPDNMIEVFVEEATELVAGLNDDFLELENLPESEMILANALRRLHTLKGSAYITKFNHIGDIAHKMEDFFQLYKTSNSDIKSEMLNSAFLALDLISDMINHAEMSGSDEIDQMTSRLAAIDNKLFSFQSLASPEPNSVGVVTPVDPVQKMAPSAQAGEKNILKIDTEYMDKMVDMASELMINQTQLGANLHALKEILADIEGEKKQIRAAENILEDTILQEEQNGETEDENGRKEEVRKISDNIKDVFRAVNLISSDLNRLTESFDQNIGRLSNISKLLHSDMLKTRMVPVDNLFNRYPRAVRDMAKKQGKRVNLIIEDNNTEMDRAMVEGLAEPILHIIRNAIDHGIETVEDRKEQDKPENGTLVLRARQERSQILIDIEDDGRGIDIDRVKEQILKRKLVEEERLERMSEAEILDFIFYPDFTTRSEATKDSGRGIGLDAVATQLQKLKGNVRLKTEQGVGTSFMLRVPLTLVISHALMVKVANQSIAMPVLAVQESIQFHKDEIIEDDDKKYIRVRGRLLPYVPLLDILQFSGPGPRLDEPDEQLAVVIFDAGISIALGIQDIVGRQEVVIKSLGSHLQNVEYIAGGTIMANGEVALILDFARVIKKVENQYFGNVPEKSSVKKVERKAKTKKPAEKKPTETAPVPNDEKLKIKIVKNRLPKIMIVDDSNSVRNFVGSILERNNFVTVKAVNGADALEKLKSEKVDLIITDLEMPKMHGFDLISHIRDQSKYARLPIIILTGRAGMKHRQTGEELGANAFIVKPFKENDLLSSIGEFIQAK